MSVTLFFTGDYVNSTAKQDFVCSGLLDVINEADVSICNLEAPLQGGGQKISKAGPHLYQPQSALNCLKTAGFDVVTLANNHIYDFGGAGLKFTVDVAGALNLKYTGAAMTFADAYKPLTTCINGIKIAIISACEYEFGCLADESSRHGYAWLNHYLIDDTIVKLKNDGYVVIVCAHAGPENIFLPIPEWRLRYKRLCDLGASAVIAHHPHVPQGIEVYNSKVIFYSLGNFHFNVPGMNDIRDDSYSVNLVLDRNGVKDYNLVFHRRIDNQTTMVHESETNFKITELNESLNHDYERRINSICLRLYNEIYKGYYEFAIGKYTNTSLKSYIINCLSRINPQRTLRERSLLLLHNIRIESHRFVTQRALAQIIEKEI